MGKDAGLMMDYWAAINEYVRACGGTPKHSVQERTERQQRAAEAVAEQRRAAERRGMERALAMAESLWNARVSATEPGSVNLVPDIAALVAAIRAEIQK